MKSIDLSNKQLDECPSNIDKDVEFLDLSFNNLTNLPSYFESFSKLKILFLSDNKFEKIPDVIMTLPSLTMLSLRNNQLIVLENVPSTVNWLILTNNKLDSIDTIGSLPNLKKLMLAGNNLSYLPDSLLHCQVLELIRLSDNNLSELPKVLFNLTSLMWISMANNPCLKNNTINYETTNQIDIEIIEQKEIIGQGASGIVKKAIHKKKQVAIKLYKNTMTSDGNSMNEIEILTSLKAHTNLSGILGLLYENQKENIIGIGKKIVGAMMPLYEDYKPLGLPPSLDTITRDVYTTKWSFSNDNKEFIVRQLNDVVSFLHTNRIIHGDLYAHNIIIDKQTNHIILTDFGASFCVYEKSVLDYFIIIENKSLIILIEEINSIT
jgi:Leucine-rich repeat (LRR) protein